MKRYVLLAILLLFAASAYAENMVAKDQGGNILTLHDQKCAISPWTTEWGTATFFYEGKTYTACWRITGDNVVVLDSAGEISVVPMFAFKPEMKI